MVFFLGLDAKQMNKTQAAIIDKIKTNGSYTVEIGGGNGPSGGAVRFGVREFKAALALIETGAYYESTRDTSVVSNRGYSVRVTSMSIRAVATCHRTLTQSRSP